jgi:hypothetical protein
MTHARFRRARTLAVFLDDGRFHVYNYISHSVFGCDPRTLALLSSLESWTDADAIMHRFAEYEQSSVASEIRRLVDRTR